MTTQQLPERPNLDHLKKQAKTLLHAAQAKTPDALARFRALPAFARKTTAEMARLAVALHDAQSVIAREHGFDSWKALREHVEEQAMSFDAAVEEFLRCATGNGPARAHRLLALHPGIARASFFTALVLGDSDTVAENLRRQPALAVQRGGPQNWQPLLYVCHTCLHRENPVRADGLVAIARQLLALGANPNGQYNWHWHAEVPRTVLWSAVCAMNHLPLAEALLQGGATPNDGVTLHMTATDGNLSTLELLRTYGVNPNGLPGGLPPLCYILGFASSIAGPRWLLEHGADANLPWTQSGEAPIHVAARKWDIAMVELLAHHGADLLRRRTDGSTPHTLAELHGNHEVAEWLLAHGAKNELSELERFVAACVRGDRAAAEAMAAARPTLRNELRPTDHLLLHLVVEREDTGRLETMLAHGFDPSVPDKDHVTPLHRAAMEGRPEAVRVLLTHGAPVNAVDAMFSAPPLIWAVEGSRQPKRAGRDHVGIVRQLIAAGSATEWGRPDSPDRESVTERLDELLRAVADQEPPA